MDYLVIDYLATLLVAHLKFPCTISRPVLLSFQIASPVVGVANSRTLKLKVSRWHVAAPLPVNFRLALRKSPQKGFPSNRKEEHDRKVISFYRCVRVFIVSARRTTAEEEKEVGGTISRTGRVLFNLNMQRRLIMSPAHREVICSLGQQTSHAAPVMASA